MARNEDSRLVYATGGIPAAKGEARTPGAPPLPRATGGKGIRLRLETRSGRVVTLVLGLVGTEKEIVALGKALRAACSAGGGVKDGVIELQGDQREKARVALAAHGLKARI